MTGINAASRTTLLLEWLQSSLALVYRDDVRSAAMDPKNQQKSRFFLFSYVLLNWFTSFFNKAHTSDQAHKWNRTLRFPQKVSPSAETIQISSCCRAGFAASLMRNNTFPMALLYQPCQNKLTRPCVILLLWSTERGSTWFFFHQAFPAKHPKIHHLLPQVQHGHK